MRNHIARLRRRVFGWMSHARTSTEYFNMHFSSFVCITRPILCKSNRAILRYNKCTSLSKGRLTHFDGIRLSDTRDSDSFFCCKLIELIRINWITPKTYISCDRGNSYAIVTSLAFLMTYWTLFIFLRPFDPPIKLFRLTGIVTQSFDEWYNWPISGKIASIDSPYYFHGWSVDLVGISDSCNGIKPCFNNTYKID